MAPARNPTTTSAASGRSEDTSAERAEEPCPEFRIIPVPSVLSMPPPAMPLLHTGPMVSGLPWSARFYSADSKSLSLSPRATKDRVLRCETGSSHSLAGGDAGERGIAGPGIFAAGWPGSVPQSWKCAGGVVLQVTPPAAGQGRKEPGDGLPPRPTIRQKTTGCRCYRMRWTRSSISFPEHAPG